MLSPVLARSVGLAHSSPLPSVHSSTEIGERILWDLGKNLFQPLIAAA